MPPDIIVIGASAGGVEAVRFLASKLPRGLPAAVFVVIHTAPAGAGLLPSILERTSALLSLHPEDGSRIEQGKIYLAPPDMHIIMRDEKHISITRGPKHNRHRPAIDPLFRSAARFMGPRTIGVVLTGFLDDGTLGLAAIKHAGGTTIVQDPDDAAAPHMPRNALNHMRPDYCVSLAEIPALLTQLVNGGAPREKVTPMSIDEKASSSPSSPPSPFTCPDCHGTIWEVREHGEVHFECRVGHSYSPESMRDAQEEDVERALWAGLRALEESAALGQRLANLAKEQKRERAREHYAESADLRRRHAETLRDLLMGTQRRIPELEGDKGQGELSESA